jgi:ribose 5-phosphate isomerase A
MWNVECGTAELPLPAAFDLLFSTFFIPHSKLSLNPKQVAAERAAAYVLDGMDVGLGTGSTTAYAIDAIGRRVRDEGLNVRCVATSQASHELAIKNGITLCDWDCLRRFDVTIDGADEVDPEFRLIKGGGGALVREKIVAAVSETEIIIVDPAKMVAHLGARALPVAVIPFGWQSTRDRLEARFNCPVDSRKAADGSVFISDDGLVVLDIHFGLLPDPSALEANIKTITGVVEVGLFVGLCHRVIIGHPDGRIQELTPA